MVGHWLGQGKIIVTWCGQPYLNFDITIDENGRIFGVVGDAKIIDGKLRRNNWILCLLGDTDYVLNANLEGDLVAGENIYGKGIKLLLDFEEGCFKGEFRSTGSKFGGKEEMKVAGRNLTLIKS